MDLKEIDILGDDISGNWYYKSKAKAAKKILSHIQSEVILDVGAGSGFFSKYLLEQTESKEAYCVDISYSEESVSEYKGKTVHFCKSVEKINSNLVLLMDVIEHVDDDVGLLKEYIEKVPAGSYFLISVPAFQFLWSSHDVFLEHKRRYNLKLIENVVNKAGLNIENSCYYFGGVFPIAFSIRILDKLISKYKTKAEVKSQLKKHHFIVNNLLMFICFLELFLFKRNRFFGLSLFCLAKKI